MKSSFDLIIVGGGLAGASLAVALRDSPLKIALVESAVPVRPVGWDARIYAVSPANATFLDHIGVWKHLDRQRMTPIAAMQVQGDAHGQIDFSAYDTGVSELGWILESSLMACELWETLKRQRNVTLLCPARPLALSFDQDAAILELNDGHQLKARLLVGADGRDSWVRNTAGLDAIDTPYGEHGLVANFRCQLPHRHVAYQWFTDDAVLAYLPLPDHCMSIVWSVPEARVADLLAMSPSELAAAVAEAGQHQLGTLECITPAAAFPLRLIRVPQTVAHRLALVGDAAHGIHPLSGHGINLGFQDARALAERLVAAPQGQDIGDLNFLRRYQRARKEETVLMQATTDQLRHLFRSQQPALRLLRNAGLNLTNALPFVKNSLVRYALGFL